MKKLAAIFILICGAFAFSACAGARYSHSTKRTLDELNRDKEACHNVARDKACNYSDKSLCHNTVLRDKLVDECLKEKYGWTRLDG